MALKPRKKSQPWYVSAFNADYLARYKHRSDGLARRELPFVLESLNLPNHPKVLDLCCGGGRHSRGLAKALPDAILVALDLSVDLLRDGQARNRARRRLHFIRADMRRIPLRTRSMDGVVNLFTSFGYFETDREHLAVLTHVARVLKPGGRFVIDFFNRDFVLAHLVKRSERAENGCSIVETRSFNKRSKRVLKSIEVSDPRRNTREIFRESVRAFSADELKQLLLKAGLTPLSLHGDLSGGVFNAESSKRCVWVSGK